jgi:hypothetical protein
MAENGWFRFPHAIFDDLKISPGAFLLYSYLLHIARGKVKCKEIHRKISQTLGFSERWVRTLEKELVANGLLKMDCRPHGKENTYYFPVLGSTDPNTIGEMEVLGSTDPNSPVLGSTDPNTNLCQEVQILTRGTVPPNSNNINRDLLFRSKEQEEDPLPVARELFDFYNENRGTLRKANSLNQSRLIDLKHLIRTCPEFPENFKKAVMKAVGLSFFKNNAKNSWLDFDWFITEKDGKNAHPSTTHIDRILEEKYDRSTNTDQRSRSQRPDTYTDQTGEGCEIEL